MLEVVDPGLLLTLQDRGRPGFTHLGIPVSGACDPWGLAVANILADAGADGVAMEVTLGGVELRAIETCAVALGGADLGAVRDDGRALRTASVHRLPAGARIRFAGSSAGMRAYVGLAGGIAAQRVLGSASTCIQGSLGGFDGRPLRAGDVLVPLRRAELGTAGRVWPTWDAPHPANAPGPIGLVPGPDLGDLPPDVLEVLATTDWCVGHASDRMGLRLDGRAMPAGREILSHPVVPGAVQVPGDGRPVIILADGPTIGGYPVVGVVPRVDLPRLGQLRPGDPVRLAPVAAVAARDAWREQLRLLATAADVLRVDAAWQRGASAPSG